MLRIRALRCHRIPHLENPRKNLLLEMNRGRIKPPGFLDILVRKRRCLGARTHFWPVSAQCAPRGCVLWELVSFRHRVVAEGME